MFLQDQRHGSAQSRHAIFIDRNEAGNAPPGSTCVLHFGLNDAAKAMPGLA